MILTRVITSVVALILAAVGPAAAQTGRNGSITHLNGELLNKEASIKMAHVPYKGSAPAVTDLIGGIGGNTDLMIGVGAVLFPQIQGGKLKALAVTSPQRDTRMPDLPTGKEQGYPGLEVAGSQGLMDPAGLPPELIARLSAALAKALERPDVRDAFANAGTPVRWRDHAEFTAFVKQENERWKSIL